MKRRIVMGLMGIFVASLFSQGVWADDPADPYPITMSEMATWLQLFHAYETAARTYIDASRDFSKGPGGSMNLLSHLKYIPSERNQGQCKNGWAWAGTGVMEIALDVQEGIFDRLSVQYIDSCFGVGSEHPCCGGSVEDFAYFYSNRGKAIPWSNANGNYQDASRTCDQGLSAVSCGSIAASPSYGIDSIVAQSIPTHGVGQATAIANIKNVLNQQKAVWFSFVLRTSEDWGNFFSFWQNQPESAVWDFDATCGKSDIDGGGHDVLCVGYNDDDPATAYWIMVNSWGTTAGRPNGIFRVAMDMDYDCTDGSYNNLLWQTLDISFEAGYQTVYVDHAGTCNGFTPCSSTIQEGIGLAATGATIKITGGTYAEDVNLKVDKDLTFKGGYTATYSTQTMETICRSLTVSQGSAAVDKVTAKRVPATDVASVVFYNDVFCGQEASTASFILDEQVFTSLSGQFSSCKEVACGSSLYWILYAPSACQEIAQFGTYTLSCSCLYQIWLTKDEADGYVLSLYPTCPGDCSDFSPPQTGSRLLLDCTRTSKNTGRGLKSMGPWSSE
jgi:hypothetical protein